MKFALSELYIRLKQSFLPERRDIAYSRFMKESKGHIIALLISLALYIMFTSVGINWGLPSSNENGFLFPKQTPWTGEQIISFSSGGARVDSQVGADVDEDPLADKSGRIVINTNESDQAKIYRRFRMFTHQPDEMITMMALSGMNPGERKLDPKLYQYGGLFIYPVGGFIKVAGTLGLINVKSDFAYYLDNPDEFGKFYIAGRLYAASWGVLGVFLMYLIGKRLGGYKAGFLAAFFFVILPVVTCMSHEAKPHLPGAVLMLLAVWFGFRVLESPAGKNWAGLFVSCGAAVGMVLSSVPIMILIPLIVWLSWRANSGAGKPGEDLSSKDDRRVSYNYIYLTIVGIAISFITYIVTNPYVLINLFCNREVLKSNFGNSMAMYEVSRVLEGCIRLGQLTVEGSTLPLTLLGFGGLVFVLIKRNYKCLPLAIPAIVFAVQFILIGAGKPDEYGRFGIFYECGLALSSACVIARIINRKKWLGISVTALVGVTAVYGTSGYLWSFHADGNSMGSRQLAANFILKKSCEPVVLSADPAPYSCPPLDFKNTPVVLYKQGKTDTYMDRIRFWNNDSKPFLEKDSFDAPKLMITAMDYPEKELPLIDDPQWKTAKIFESRKKVFGCLLLPRSRMSWANKPMVILIR